MSNHRIASDSSAANHGTPRRRRRMTLVDWFGLSCFILLTTCSSILYVRLKATDMLTETLLQYMTIALVALIAIHVILLLPRWRNKAPKLVFSILALLVCGGLLYGVSAADSIQSALMSISGKMSEQETTYIMVMDDDKAVEISDTLGYNFGSMSTADLENTPLLLEAVQQGLGDIESTQYDTVPALVQALYDGEVDAIMLNEGYISLLETMEEYSNYSDVTRVIYEFTTEKELEPIAPNPLITREPFVVYCSGIDSRYRDINIKSLSDVNILAVVNPETRQILLINTPRDYYVPMVSKPYAGQRDKLTHAGMIGVEESMKVLSQLYGVEAKYYVRVNFAGLVDIVDALGGIEVTSPKDFTTESMYIPSVGHRTFTFKKGVNQINGQQALAFSRERYAFEDGDNQRGKNQMAVIKGIVDKAVSPQILASYDELLQAAEGCFITNMPYEDISALVKMQLKDMRGWSFESYAVTGYADYQQCASMPGWDLWVMWPEEQDIETAKELIQQVLTAKLPEE